MSMTQTELSNVSEFEICSFATRGNVRNHLLYDILLVLVVPGTADAASKMK